MQKHAQYTNTYKSNQIRMAQFALMVGRTPLSLPRAFPSFSRPLPPLPSLSSHLSLFSPFPCSFPLLSALPLSSLLPPPSLWWCCAVVFLFSAPLFKSSTAAELPGHTGGISDSRSLPPGSVSS